jgi:superfamily II DNA or RNA helicase/HKD family nuclease
MSFENNLKESLHTGFVDGSNLSLDVYQPHLLINDSLRGRKVLTSLINELNKCDEFFFSVAFITNSGVASLINTLLELEEKGVKGKMIASQYQNFTEPIALTRLTKLKNIDIRIVTEGNFHAKGYIFKKSELYSLIVGSSNLTQNALSVNKEWNIRLASSDRGTLILSILDEFNRTYKGATVVNDDWIAQYKVIYDDSRRFERKGKEAFIQDYDENKACEQYNRTPDGASIVNDQASQDTDLRGDFIQDHGEIVTTEEKLFFINRISPNKMQIEALRNLSALRDNKKKKALLISATGTGKTYLSAFDVKSLGSKRFLFVVHRENIAREALKSYRNILGYTRSMAILSGNSKNIHADFIFSTIQTISKDEIYRNYKRNHFDYIVIDEVHRSGAASYMKIIEYFSPKFLLGMTATPERTDGYNIFKTFEYNIAYEIRLHQALEENMLSPFHYYGVSDISVDGHLIDDKADFNRLVCSERVDKVIHYSKLYGCDNDRIKGLIFCSRREEASRLSRIFNDFGYSTICLDGDSSETLREESIERLESDANANKLDYIFTVDIFNEGVDIPSVNQIIMLRPTQSAIIFVQQLGRGLRKAKNKEYLTVIDFIGNYSNNYLVPIALYGDNSFNKDNIRKLIKSGSSFIPGASTINFDLITKQKIFEAIDAANLSRKMDMRKDYELLKYKLGKIPTMMDFLNHGSRDPYSFVEYSGSYYSFISDVEAEINGQLSKSEKTLLEFYSKEVLNGKRIEELVILRNLFDSGSISIRRFVDLIESQYGIKVSPDKLPSILSYLNGAFFKDQEKTKYGIKKTVYDENGVIQITSYFADALKNSNLRSYLIDTLDYAVNKFNGSFSLNKYHDGLILYQKYSRKDACRILFWDSDESSTIYGYRIKHNTCPIFVTYHKTDDISESTKYEDRFVDSGHFSWMTRSKVRIDSNEVVQLKNFKNGLRILLFVKKSDSEGSDFYYMGDMEPLEFFQTNIHNDKKEELPIVNILYQMKVAVDDAILRYLEG